MPKTPPFDPIFDSPDTGYHEVAAAIVQSKPYLGTLWQAILERIKGEHGLLCTRWWRASSGDAWEIIARVTFKRGNDVPSETLEPTCDAFKVFLRLLTPAQVADIPADARRSGKVFVAIKLYDTQEDMAKAIREAQEVKREEVKPSSPSPSPSPDAAIAPGKAPPTSPSPASKSAPAPASTPFGTDVEGPGDDRMDESGDYEAMEEDGDGDSDEDGGGAAAAIASSLSSESSPSASPRYGDQEADDDDDDEEGPSAESELKPESSSSSAPSSPSTSSASANVETFRSPDPTTCKRLIALGQRSLDHITALAKTHIMESDIAFNVRSNAAAAITETKCALDFIMAKNGNPNFRIATSAAACKRLLAGIPSTNAPKTTAKTKAPKVPKAPKTTAKTKAPKSNAPKTPPASTPTETVSTPAEVASVPPSPAAPTAPAAPSSAVVTTIPSTHIDVSSLATLLDNTVTAMNSLSRLLKGTIE